jgi:DNA repair exonuclease SbcCD nuclease subunit
VRDPISIVHTADCHLGSSRDFGAAEFAFASLITGAIDLSADILVIAGDLFDSSAVPEQRVSWAAEELRRLKKPIVALPGNHDPWGPESIYRCLLRSEIEGLHVVTAPQGETFCVGGVTFWGRAVVSHDPGFRPLLGIPVRPSGWGVVVAHGLVLAGPEPTPRGSPIYPTDLRAADWDYIALGHWPQFRQIEGYPARICYSGALPTARHGRPGAVLVELDESKVGVSQVELGPVYSR